MNRRAGFTLFELLVSTALILVLLGGVWTLFDIFTAMETRGRRDTARARLTRGLFMQMQDDIVQATQRVPPKTANTTSAVRVNTTDQKQSTSDDAPPPEDSPAESETPADSENESPDGEPSSQFGLDDAESESSDFEGLTTTDEGAEAEQADTPFGAFDETVSNAQPPEYATLVGSRSWMMLDLPILEGDEKPLSALERISQPGGDGSSGNSGINWIATKKRQRVIYQFIAPEDQIADENLTVGLTRWQIDWQLASANDLSRELNEREFGSLKSVIWQRPTGSGAGSALSFLSNTPQIEKEEIPELKRILFRYFESNGGWTSSWNSITRGGLPAAVQMRVLWHDVRTPVGDDAPVDELGRPNADRFNAQDAKEELELLSEWDNDSDSGYGYSTTVTLAPPPEGYAEYTFRIPSMAQPVRSQIGDTYGGVR